MPLKVTFISSHLRPLRWRLQVFWRAGGWDRAQGIRKLANGTAKKSNNVPGPLQKMKLLK